MGPTPTAGGKWQAGNLRGRRCRGQNRGRQSPAQSREVAGCTNERKSCLSGKSVTSPENEDKAQQTRADSTGNRQRQHRRKRHEARSVHAADRGAQASWGH